MILMSPAQLWLLLRIYHFWDFILKAAFVSFSIDGTEYRMATYLGVKVIKCAKDKIILEQGKYKLEIDIDKNNGQELSAPSKGEMTRTIIENGSLRRGV